MKHIIKVNDIQVAKDNRIRPLIAMDNSGVLFSRGPVPKGFVDFGLPSGTLWSTKNIGATNGDTAESWYGNYYAWGEIETKEVYDWDTYKFGASQPFSKYDSDGKTVLESEDDIASKTNSAQRMPTMEDIKELIAGTTSRWVTDYKGISGLNGRVFTKAEITRPAFKKDPLYLSGEGEITDELWAEISIYTLEEINALFEGDITTMIFKDAEMTESAKPDIDYGFTEKEVDPSVSMFIPAAGYYEYSDIIYAGSGCGLWSSSLNLGRHKYATSFVLDSNAVVPDFNDRCQGLSVRPVC